MRIRKLLAVLAILLLPALAFAQAETTGRVVGKVVDEEGNPVVGARVSFVSPALLGERIVTTAANGQFIAALLPVGAYSVTAAAPGMQPQQISFRLGVGQTVPLDLTLKRGEAVVEQVTVYGTASKLETTTGGENFNFDQTVNQLPIVGRDLNSIATYAPNVSFGPTGGNVSIAGAPSYDTTAMLDGAEISDPYFGAGTIVYLEDAIEEVQVMTSGISARYGRFQGGIINAITKSGSNTFQASARVDLSKQSWNAKTPYSAETQSTDLTKVYQATVGGFIVKDRLWFFAGGRTIPTDELAQTTRFTNQSWSRTRDEDRWQLKLRGAITPDHVVEASYLEYDASIDGYAGLPAGDLRAASGIRTDPRDITTLSYQGVLSPNLFVDFIGTQKRVQIAGGGSDAALGTPMYWLNGNMVFGNHWWDVNDPDGRDNDTLGINLTQAINTADWGSHTLEFGASYVKSTTTGENRQSMTGLNVLAFDLGTPEFVELVGGTTVFNFTSIFNEGHGVIYRWEALPFPGSPEQELENTALYIQDAWQLGKWRFDAGARWEKYEGKGPFPTLDLDFSEFSPRFGVTYNIDQNWQVQATYGKYISRFNDNVASAVSGVGGAPFVETLYTGPNQLGVDYATANAIIADRSLWAITTFINNPATPVTFMDPDATAPYANDFNLSIKRALPRNTGTFTATYTDRQYKDLLDDFVGGQGILNISDPFTGSTDPYDRTIWKNSDEAVREYQAIAATIDYRPSATWNIGGNWTLAKNRGNYEGEGQNTPSSGSIIGVYPESIPQEAAVPYGYLDEDIRHRVRLWGNYRLNFDRAGSLIFGPLFTYQSGRNWSKTASRPMADHPDYIADFGSYTHFFDGRGNNRFNGWWRFDLSTRYTVPIVSKLDIYVKLDVINVLNNDELIAHQTTGTSALNDAGVRVWVPTGNCGPNDPPSESCTGFGRIRNQLDYQTPRSYFVAIGLNW
jgi:outer membrane receptor protein involved in Fe transport